MSPGVGGRHFLVDAAHWRGPFGLGIGEEGRLLAGTVHLAGDSAARRRGLLGRETLDMDQALVIAPTCAVHTFGMRMPLDIAFADKAGRVVAIAEAVPPRRLRAGWRAFAAVELAAGRCRAVGLRVGDQLRAIPPTSGVE